MKNPMVMYRTWMARLGKPIRPIVELQKGGTLINIVTTSKETIGGIIQDEYSGSAWEFYPSDETKAIYVDGVYKGQGYFVGEEGHVLSIKKDVELFKEGKDKQGSLIRIPILSLVFKGINSKVLDAAILEMGSSLKSSFTDKLVWAFIGFLLGYVVVSAYAPK